MPQIWQYNNGELKQSGSVVDGSKCCWFVRNFVVGHYRVIGRNLLFHKDLRNLIFAVKIAFYSTQFCEICKGERGTYSGNFSNFTGKNVIEQFLHAKTIRSHLHPYQEGGIYVLKQRVLYHPQSKLNKHKPE